MFRKLMMAVFLFVPFHLMAQEGPPVVEIFDCVYNDGQGPEDLEKAVEYYQGQDLPGDDGYFAAVFSPIRASNNGYDVHWVGASQNLKDWTDTLMAGAGNAKSEAVQERFNKVVSCDSGLFASAQVYIGTEIDTSDNEVIAEAYGCNLREGRTMANVLAAEETYAAAAKAAGLKHNIFKWTPYIANVPWDMIYIIGHSDLSAFAANEKAENNDAATSLANLNFLNQAQCKGGLYAVDIVKRPTQDQ